MLTEQEKFIESLHDEYQLDIMNYAIANLKKEIFAEDVMQDTFKEAIEQVEYLMTHPEPKFWLLRTAKNKIYNIERSQRRYLHRVLSMDSDLLAEIADPRQIEMSEAISEDTGVAEIEKTIERTLTPDEAVFLRRLTLEKVSHLEVAEELGISVWASQKRLERIRKKLKKKLFDKKRK